MIKTYTISTDTLNAKVDLESLETAIQDSTITIAIDLMDVTGDILTITFKAVIATSEHTTLTGIVNAHTGVEVTQPDTEVDIEGRQVTRVAAAKKGWAYIAHFFEFETSKDGSLFCEDWSGTVNPAFSMSFHKSDGTSIVDEGSYADKQAHIDAECVETKVLYKPDFDYELVSGDIRMIMAPTEDCRTWVIGGAVELGAIGTKEFVSGVNFKFLGADEVVHTDGRASKFMAKTTTGVPYQTNQLQIIVRHSAGNRHRLMYSFEYFRG